MTKVIIYDALLLYSASKTFMKSTKLENIYDTQNFKPLYIVIFLGPYFTDLEVKDVIVCKPVAKGMPLRRHQNILFVLCTLCV